MQSSVIINLLMLGAIKKMRYLRSGLIIGCMFIGLGTASAQFRIYNTPEGIEEPQVENNNSRPSIYIAPSQDNTMASSGIITGGTRSFYGDKIRLNQNIKYVNEKIEIFQAWQQSGREPETIEEIQSYAKSRRGLIQKKNLERRKALIAHLERKSINRTQYASQRKNSSDADYEANFTFENSQSGGGLNAKAAPKRTNKTNSVTITKPRLFVSPNDGN
ncbi:MAG: hypothetical protein CBB87_06795 [Micavibrio sp. TMED27]|nr:MAG: hypothetical protein CBB87_06795 [Micavibrio sp. TMED27]|tara:strand:- start:3050 stop:3703 length:654 start_codon:yes stop_codon:yes gene_type:complete